MRQRGRRTILHKREMTAQTIMKRQHSEATNTAPSRASIDLYWLPLGAGGHSVRLNGRVYEALAARLGGRPVSAPTPANSYLGRDHRRSRLASARG